MALASDALVAPAADTPAARVWSTRSPDGVLSEKAAAWRALKRGDIGERSGGGGGGGAPYALCGETAAGHEKLSAGKSCGEQL